MTEAASKPAFRTSTPVEMILINSEIGATEYFSWASYHGYYTALVTHGLRRPSWHSVLPVVDPGTSRLTGE